MDLLIEYLKLRFLHPEKSEEELFALFRELAKQGKTTVDPVKRFLIVTAYSPNTKTTRNTCGLFLSPPTINDHPYTFKYALALLHVPSDLQSNVAWSLVPYPLYHEQ